MEEDTNSEGAPTPPSLQALTAYRLELLGRMQQLVEKQRDHIDQLRGNPPALSKALHEIGIEIDRVMREQDVISAQITAIVSGGEGGQHSERSEGFSENAVE